MAYVLSDEVKEVVYKKVRTLTGIRCDICGEVVPALKHPDKPLIIFDVSTGHSLWGNDSIDSFEHYEICPKCINKFVADYLDNAERTYQIDIEAMLVYPHDVHVN